MSIKIWWEFLEEFLYGFLFDLKFSFFYVSNINLFEIFRVLVGGLFGRF